MVYTEDYIKDKLQNGLRAKHVEVEDVSDGCGMKFVVTVVSEFFEGKAMLARHRLVNAVLEEEMKTIHALSQRTFTPLQWEERKV